MLSNINTRIGSAINYVSVNVYNLYNRTVSETMNEYRERLGVNINTISCSILDAISFVSDFDITFYENPESSVASTRITADPILWASTKPF